MHKYLQKFINKIDKKSDNVVFEYFVVNTKKIISFFDYKTITCLKIFLVSQSHSEAPFTMEFVFCRGVYKNIENKNSF